MYKCKCCGHETLPVPPEDAVAYICPICWWENDVFTADDDEPSDENHGLTLNEGRKNYKQYGICDSRLKEPMGRRPDETMTSQVSESDQIIGGVINTNLSQTPNQENPNDIYRIQKTENQYIQHRLGTAK